MKSRHADFLLIVVAIIWGLGFIGTKYAIIAELTPYQIVAARFTVAALVLLVVFFKEIVKIDRQTLIAGIIIGIFLFLAFITQTIANLHTTVSKCAFLTGTNVVMVPFIYWMIFKERPDSYSFAGAFLTVVGIGLLTLDGGFSSINYGDILTIICALFFALHILTTGHYTKKYSPVQLTFIQIATAAVLGIICMFIEGAELKYSTAGFVSVGYLGIFSTFVAYLLQNIGQKYTSTTNAAIFLSTEALFGAIFAVIFLKDVLTFKMILGCAIIFFAIITTETKWEFLLKKGKVD